MASTLTRITSLFLLTFMLSSGQAATGPFLVVSKDVFENCTARHGITHEFDPKPETCCKTVGIRCGPGDITRCIISQQGHGCRAAVIFFYGSNTCCVGKRIPWVKEKLDELKKMGKPCQNATTPPSKKCP